MQAKGRGDAAVAPAWIIASRSPHTRRCTYMLNAIVSPRTRGPWRGGAAAPHIEHCFRSIHSPSGATSLATLVVPHAVLAHRGTA